jgi:polar amino acid transport system substrate-binding protein
MKLISTRNALVVAALTLVSGFFAPGAQALTCGEKYTVQSGDTLNALAREAYGLANKWTLIFYANQKQFGNGPILEPGKQLNIPCIKAPEDVSIEPAGVNARSNVDAPDAGQIEVSRIKGDVQLLTAGDYQPFTDRALPAGGMITEIVNTALATLQTEAQGPGYQISWVNDWSSHLNPLLASKTFDMGFPWFKPNCDEYDQLDAPARFRCDKFFFSKPVFEILVLFFATNDNQFQFTSDADVLGARLCRPTGYFTFDLDKKGRNWVKDEKVSLIRPQTVEECFQMLSRGEVDAVTLNEFTGRAAVKKLNMDRQIRVIERPVSLLNLHVIIAKTHPRARTYLHYINSSLTFLRESGVYEQIVDKHLSRFWGSQGG